MNTPKKIRKAIAKKFTNWKDSKEIAMEEPRLACIGFALYNALNPNTKLEKVESAEQPIVQPVLNSK
ncbi:hypothetical protein [Candidatus Wolbachia massiliensis]|uniref:Uncharacterized protein n=1 Tax=Candidatus Wolbachia massiliensis TaxID=1845000 RepID=A0A7L7YQC3_9RICK|nr:hypothetical protein [Candidatus Wolbachia massiliensis]QOD37976.1 hypothetical protein ID128_03950 [Candidatus Wolbachia massiliensis]